MPNTVSRNSGSARNDGIFAIGVGQARAPLSGAPIPPRRECREPRSPSAQHDSSMQLLQNAGGAPGFGPRLSRSNSEKLAGARPRIFALAMRCGIHARRAGPTDGTSDFLPSG